MIKSTMKPFAPMVKPPIIGEAFSRISCDIIGPLRLTSKGNKYIFTIVDHATRWAEAYAEAYSEVDHSAMTLVNAMIDYFSRFGILKEVLHDLGADFTSELYSEMCNYFGISQLQCSVSHPQTNTVVERFNGTLKKMLRAFVYENELDWDQGLCYVLFSYRELPIEELGFSPFELTFGKDVKGPLAAVYTTW